MNVATDKRTVFQDEDLGANDRKRRKLDGGHVVSTWEEIQSARALKLLLVFQQDDTSKLRQSIQTFKIFLESIIYATEGVDRSKEKGILLEYLQYTVPAEEDEASNPLPDVIQTWSFAAQSNHDGLLSAVPAVLALLLKTISGLIDFRRYGVHLCKALLRKEQIRLFDRGLTANKSKEHLISPCLRLLTEIVTFDGGNSARTVYVQHDVTFKRLDIFLGMKSTSTKETKGDRPRPSVRSNSVRFLLANLRMQDRATKGEILSQSRLIRALFHGLAEDSSEFIREVLECVKKSLILDDSLARRHKSRLLTDWTLTQIARLYDYGEDDPAKEGQLSIPDYAHEFLVFVCTTLDQGVLVEQHGWYPPGFERDKQKEDEKDTPLSHYPSNTPGRQLEKIPVKNMTLSSFLQGLRPYANTYHWQLILAIFRAAPELIADYFFKKKSFSFDPKLSATWIGYSSFLFAVVQLPSPETSGAVPPPTEVVLESILPQPMSRKTLTKCLNQKTELITFFATRLLIIAFKKLRGIRRVWYKQDNVLWTRAYLLLVTEFEERCPELRHVIAALRNVSKHNGMLREALLRLIMMYYKVTPQLALCEKFDISGLLTDKLSECGIENGSDEDKGIHRLELDHLLQIARRSPDLAWWHRPEKSPLSTFTTILKLYASKDWDAEDHVKSLLRSIIHDHFILQRKTKISALAALKNSLRKREDYKVVPELYAFLDNCMLRLVRKPVKYCGDADELAKEFTKSVGSSNRKKSPISLLHFALLEQWPFLVEAGDEETIEDTACFLAIYLCGSEVIGEDAAILRAIRIRMRKLITNKPYASLLDEDFYKTILKGVSRDLQTKSTETGHSTGTAVEMSTNHETHRPKPTSDSILIDSELLEENEDHPGLNRWSTEDMEVAIEDGAVGELLLCLCSKHSEIRKQALINIRILVAKLKASGYKEREQMILLLGELTESAKNIISADPLPYFAGAIAARSILVLNNPLHFMYTKVNKFLNKSPEWNISKLPSYWIGKILLAPPTDDDAHHREIVWLLDTLIEGLRTPADMEQYRRCGIFERVLSLSASPSTSKACIEKIIQLIYRCSLVGGSTTLVTRFGVMSWIESQQAMNGPHHVTFKVLASQIQKTCEVDRVQEWSDGALARAVEKMNP
ncbi:hypothetical protein MMC30_007547 [Trapelia coarctata]|nr:hypothetical protein [Trapelia coarctata]